MPLCTPPSGKIFVPEASTLLCLLSNGVFNFNFLALLLSEILGSPKFTLGGPTPPWTPLSGEMFVPKASTLQYLIVVLIVTLQP